MLFKCKYLCIYLSLFLSQLFRDILQARYLFSQLHLQLLHLLLKALSHRLLQFTQIILEDGINIL